MEYRDFYKEVMFPKDFDRNRLGSCMGAAALATDYLLQKGITDFKIVEGWITLDPDWEETGNLDSHTWLEIKGKIFDPTKKQFKNWYGDDWKNIQYVKVKKKYSPQQYQSVCQRQPNESLEEDYPPSWNLETFKSLKSFSKRVAYCNEHLQRLASGSSRIAYKIDEQKVLKLAKNKKGIAQNSVERDWYVQDAYEDVVAKVFEVDPNDLWLEMELAKKIGPNRFKAIVGASVDDVGMYLQEMDNRDHGKQSPWRRVDDKVREQLDQNEWVQRVYTLCREVDLSPGDFGRISSFGEVVREGKPSVVIIDMGLTHTVYNDFYGVN